MIFNLVARFPFLCFAVKILKKIDYEAHSIWFVQPIGVPRWALKAQLNQYFIGFTNGRVE